MSKTAKWLIGALCVILLTLAVLTAAAWKQYRGAACSMPADAGMTLREQPDGTLLLRWDAAEAAERYYVTLTAYKDGAEGTLLFPAVCDVPECVLPAWLPEDQAVVLSVTPLRDYSVFGLEKTRMGRGLKAASYLNPPKAEDVSVTVDWSQAKAYVSWSGWKGDRYRLSRLGADGSLTPVQELDHVGTELVFDGSALLRVPDYGEQATFVLEPSRTAETLRFYGQNSSFSVAREAFLADALQLESTPEGENAYCLTWNETKGSLYRISSIDPVTGAETLLAEFRPEDRREYHTGHLAAYSDFIFQISALGGGDRPEDMEVAQPARVELRTASRLLYSTVWPLRELDIRSEPNGAGEKLGTMLTTRGYCVTGASGDWLQISTPRLTGYVDGKKCMINLPDYIGPLCAYDITNSYSSLYRVHDYDIPRVSGTVVSGYENVRLAEGEYLVPLLYPTSNCLIRSAEKAYDEGFRLKIYDSFRPNQATRSIYDLTELVLYDPLPARTYNNAVTAEREGETYAQLMTNGVWSLGSFLASSGSMHNFGVAMDLTIEALEDGSELSMQTAIHDLSWYSAAYLNNYNATKLRNYMKFGGFGGLSSEWWHYQDNEAYSSYGLSNRLNGVDAKGWVLDDAGWRWRRADGSYLRDTETEIDGDTYRFDKNGYLVSE